MEGGGGMAIKRVGVGDLRAGMYVHDLNCGWLQHGFLRPQFMLRHPGALLYPVGSLARLSGGRLAVVIEQGEHLLRPTVRVVYDTGRKIRLQPRDLHLAHATEQIVDYEDPAEWGLDPASYL